MSSDNWWPVEARDITLGIKAFGVLGSPPNLAKTPSFRRATPATGLLRQFGADLRRAFVPLALEPSKTFHQRLANALRKRGFSTAEDRFPLRAELRTGLTGRVNVRLHLYAPSIVCATVHIDSLDGNFSLGPNDLIDLQQTPDSSLVRCLLTSAITEVAAATDSPDRLEFRSSFPALEVRRSWPSGLAETSGSQARRDLVALLIRQRSAASLGSELVDDVWKRNAALNRKNVDECLLADKQGLLHLRLDTDDTPSVYELRRSHDLAEIAIVFGIFLAEYPSMHRAYPDFADFIADRVRAWIDDPNPQLFESVGYRLLFDVLSEGFALPSRLESFHGGPDNETRRVFEQYADGWWTDPHFYEVLSERVAATEGVEFSYVTDPDFRRILIRDLHEARRARDAHNFKSAMVMAGSVIEAALLARLSVADPAKSGVFSELGLGNLFAEAEARRLIAGASDVKKSVDTVATFRNLIHPGREQRLGLEPNSQRADISIAAMELILRGLSGAPDESRSD